jgi:hypothetical protein
MPTPRGSMVRRLGLLLGMTALTARALGFVARRCSARISTAGLVVREPAPKSLDEAIAPQSAPSCFFRRRRPSRKAPRSICQRMLVSGNAASSKFRRIRTCEVLGREYSKEVPLGKGTSRGKSSAVPRAKGRRRAKGGKRGTECRIGASTRHERFLVGRRGDAQLLVASASLRLCRRASEPSCSKSISGCGFLAMDVSIGRIGLRRPSCGGDERSRAKTCSEVQIEGAQCWWYTAISLGFERRLVA